MTSVRQPGAPSLRRAGIYAALGLVAAGLAYSVLSKLAGFSEITGRLGNANLTWLLLGGLLTLGSFASYATLFHRVVASGRHGRPAMPATDSAQVAVGALGAATLFSAGGAGGVAFEYWALRQSGVPRWKTGLRLATFNVLLYAIYMAALIVVGVWLWAGLPGGPAPALLSLLPAFLAAVVVVTFLLAAAYPDGGSLRQLVGRATRRAISIAAQPKDGGVALFAAVAFWATNIATLAACFAAFGESVPVSVLIQGFFVGMVANLVPFIPGGAGAVDAGLVGAFVALGEPASAAIVAVFTYRLIAYWLPTVPELLLLVRMARRLAAASPIVT